LECAIKEGGMDHGMTLRAAFCRINDPQICVCNTCMGTSKRAILPDLAAIKINNLRFIKS
jgi:hypothetical protein